jgi:hypothetical protein
MAGIVICPLLVMVAVDMNLPVKNLPYIKVRMAKCQQERRIDIQLRAV